MSRWKRSLAVLLGGLALTVGLSLPASANSAGADSAGVQALCRWGNVYQGVNFVRVDAGQYIDVTLFAWGPFGYYATITQNNNYTPPGKFVPANGSATWRFTVFGTDPLRYDLRIDIPAMGFLSGGNIAVNSYACY
ncbi:MAG TPA: hypothetical protein VGX25_10570 [Actinophytocola sp.]|uniref:hypothetical protein n=1 Tax=Actinophytocola sp. TaxID=1872138 RepID=UPI002DDD7E9A|nr:hypothetical protein [Actinophytocola sp.]HEV2779829.1 hypothetical protein [Actinophytocola sp.]